ncbi:MAG: adenylate/guanylate cyclase domain-containing protein, partial [Rickettsiales bacterium]|nr:adenylate/guanylate cyclase domain-containing protein [Rickettsiales bacterium]
FNSIPDDDGVVRRVPLLLQTKGEIYPSLAMEALRVAQGASSYTVKMAGASGETSYGGASTGITHLRNGHFEIPTDKYGNFLMYYTDTDAANDRYISAWQVLDDNFDASLVEGHILFLGTSAPGLKDLRATPMDPSLPGVEVHAQALEQVLAEQYLVRPDWMDGAEVVMMLAFGIILIVVMAQLTAIWGAVFMLVVQAGAIYFSLHMFRTHGYLIDPISPGIAILLLYLTESLRRYISSEQERKQVRSAFGQYMSPVLVEQLAKDPNKLKLGGEMKELSVLFCDIRGFTTISEQFNAQELTAFINRFLTPMTNVILERKGTIDKYMGDCIMAFWNAPLDDEEHARNASEAALGMFAELRELNAERKMRAGEEGREYLPVNIGIGINTGEICVGNMGSEQRFDYSVLGDDVNLASRLEGQSKTYGVDIVIGENTRCQLENMALLELDLIRVKGKTSAVTIYALMGDESLYEKPAFQELVDLWKKTLKAYRTKEWDGARNFINLCRTQVAKLEGVELETLFRLYEARIAAYKITPPPEDWDGVFIATSK